MLKKLFFCILDNEIMIEREYIKNLLHSEILEREVKVNGWVRTFRSNRFIAINDGSTVHNIQVVVDLKDQDKNELKRISTGASIEIIGQLIESKGSGQSVEIQAKSFSILGDADPETYPLQSKQHSLEFLRDIAHLRMRTNTFSSIFRIRHGVSFAIHKYFNDHGFYYIHSPIITGSDCEGAGKMFNVSVLNKKKNLLNQQGEIDYSQDFFGKEANLTVSGQLEAELAVLALDKVYTFGPTFRAENSNTSRHLAEFWMIEPEIAFADLTDNINLVEDFLKFIIKYVLSNYNDDLSFLELRLINEEKTKREDQRSLMPLREKLQFILKHAFKRISYTEAIDILKKSKPNKKKRFNYLIENWGTDLQSEHEKYLVEKHFKCPVVLYDYPKEIKAFYMRQNNDKKTVRAMDVLFPGVGEIAGGSQREERYDMLLKKIKDFKIDKDSLWWYLETRKFGTVPHAGFGLGFERLMQFITGMSNIRDVIPFPRTPNNAEF